MRITLLAMFTLLLASLPAQANRLWVHLGSNHLDGGDYNEFNPGLAGEIDLIEFPSGFPVNQISVEGGFYKNSFKNRANYSMLNFTLLGTSRTDWQIGAGSIIVDGYENIRNDKAHGPVPFIRYKRLRVLALGNVLGFSVSAFNW